MPVTRSKDFNKYTVNTTKEIKANPIRIVLGFYHSTTNTVEVANAIGDPSEKRNAIPTTTWVWYKWPEDDTKSGWAIITNASTEVQVYESFGERVA